MAEDRKQLLVLHRRSGRRAFGWGTAIGLFILLVHLFLIVTSSHPAAVGIDDTPESREFLQRAAIFLALSHALAGVLTILLILGTTHACAVVFGPRVPWEEPRGSSNTEPPEHFADLLKIDLAIATARRAQTAGYLYTIMGIPPAGAYAMLAALAQESGRASYVVASFAMLLLAVATSVLGWWLGGELVNTAMLEEARVRRPASIISPRSEDSTNLMVPADASSGTRVPAQTDPALTPPRSPFSKEDEAGGGNAKDRLARMENLMDRMENLVTSLRGLGGSVVFNGPVLTQAVVAERTAPSEVSQPPTPATGLSGDRANGECVASSSGAADGTTDALDHGRT